MTTSTTRTSTAKPDSEHVAMMVLRALSKAASSGRRTTHESLAKALGVRRVELRSILSTLHRQGLVDVLRMRPTLVGFAMGRAAQGLCLAPLRCEIPAAPASRAA